MTCIERRQDTCQAVVVVTGAFSDAEVMQTVLVTGASSGIGALTCRRLGDAGYVVFAGMREVAGRNSTAADAARRYGDENEVRLHPIDLDVTDDASVRGAVSQVLEDSGSLDVLVHNAGHMVIGPAEAFTPQELAQLYDTNVLGTQRVNRAALPHLRRQGHGLVVWVGSSSTRGGTPPFLAPYFAAKAAMDSLAVSYASELIKFGIDTTIVVPGPFTSGTSHFEKSGRPTDGDTASAYAEPYGEIMAQIPQRLAGLEPPGADVGAVAQAIVDVVERPPGHRPFRVHVDPTDDGAAVVSAVADRMRVEFFRRLGFETLLEASSLPH